MIQEEASCKGLRNMYYYARFVNECPRNDTEWLHVNIRDICEYAKFVDRCFREDTWNIIKNWIKNVIFRILMI